MQNGKCLSKLSPFAPLLPSWSAQRPLLLLLAAAPLLGLTACGPASGEPRLIEEWRSTALLEEDFKWNASTAERFRLRRTSGPSQASSVHYETPAGWTELPKNSLRQANFLVNGDEQAECYLTVLPGTGGGLVANINRWRKQMSLEPISDADAMALPRSDFYGGSASRVDFVGTWSGMSGDQSGEGFRLVGLLLVDESASKFLKMVGPASLIGAAIPAFDALAASFHSSESHGAPKESHAEHSHDDDPHDHAAHAGDAKTEQPVATNDGKLSFETPDGWSRAPDRQMREVTFTVGADADQAECYVALLGGTGGGISANMNRWRQQMGAPPLSEAEFQALERIEMFGREGILLEVDGSFSGMAGEAVSDARLYGAVCVLSDRSVFVKMIGPISTLEGQRDAFRSFCESLSFGE